MDDGCWGGVTGRKPEETYKNRISAFDAVALLFIIAGCLKETDKAHLRYVLNPA